MFSGPGISWFGHWTATLFYVGNLYWWVAPYYAYDFAPTVGRWWPNVKELRRWEFLSLLVTLRGLACSSPIDNIPQGHSNRPIKWCGVFGWQQRQSTKIRGHYICITSIMGVSPTPPEHTTINVFLETLNGVVILINPVLSDSIQCSQIIKNTKHKLRNNNIICYHVCFVTNLKVELGCILYSCKCVHSLVSTRNTYFCLPKTIQH